MHLVTIAWMYVVLMMALAEATSADGTVLGAVFTFLLYGALPLSIVLYVMGTPGRRRARRAAEAAANDAARAGAPTPARAEDDASPPDGGAAASAQQPGGRRHAPGDPVAPEREEP